MEEVPENSRDSGVSNRLGVYLGAYAHECRRMDTAFVDRIDHLEILLEPEISGNSMGGRRDVPW